jgi:hypothetical protein
MGFGHTLVRIGVLARSLFSLQSTAARRRRANYRRRLSTERLEPRTVLSANPIYLDAATSALIIEGTSGNDDVTIAGNSQGRINVKLTTLGGSFAASYELSSVAYVEFRGGDGDDRFQNASSV